MKVSAEGGEADHHRPVPHDRGQLGQEQAGVAPGPPPPRDGLGLGQGQGLVAAVGLEHRPGHTPRAGLARLRGRGQSGPRGPERQAQGGRELGHALRRAVEGQRLDVDQAVRDGQPAEEAVDLVVASHRGQVVGGHRRGPALVRGPGLDLDSPELRPTGQVADVTDVRRGSLPRRAGCGAGSRGAGRGAVAPRRTDGQPAPREGARRED